MPTKTIKTLRAVADDERRETPKSLLEAVESGDVLEMLHAQRRLIAEALVTAAENTRPQFNNELNKLHALIAAEESRRIAADQDGADASDDLDDEAFDASAV
jgi:hypothetical protein